MDPTSDDVWKLLNGSWNLRYGYTAPNVQQYPHQWLWDSCFHAIAWSRFKDPRALTELMSLFSRQLPSGFLPNMIYRPRQISSRFLWKNGMKGISDITQPPMYGHAIRVLHDQGYDVSALVQPATRALEFLFRERMTPSGLVKIVHPWESGCDDIARWDSWNVGKFRRKTWNLCKYVFVRRLRLDHGASVANPAFEVCSAGFNALLAFNATELASVTKDLALARQADALTARLEEQWNPVTKCWDDLPLGRKPRPSSSAPTIDALLPLLVSRNPAHRKEAWDAVLDPKRFWGEYGPRSLSREDPRYDPNGYWRGGVWGQMTYLLWVAAEREGNPHARELAKALVAGANASRFAEHWNPESGKGNGAIPLGFSATAAIASASLV